MIKQATRTSQRSAASQSSKGFTLVELLVVVAIIALLVSILLPTLGKAKEQTKIVMCLSNLRGLGLGYSMYTLENNNWYPQSCGAGGYDPTWDYVLMNYYGNRKLLRCPADPPSGDPYANCSRKERWDEALWRDEVAGEFRKMPEKDRFARSYAMNANVCSQGPSWWDPTWPRYVHKTSHVTHPDETIMLSEAWYWSYNPGGYVVPNIHNDYAGSHTTLGYGSSSYFHNMARGPTFDVHRNNDAANYLFCDLHVVTLSEDDPKLFDSFGGYEYYYFRVNK